jgi:hypothetical protein
VRLAAAATLTALALAGCSPGAPKGVSQENLDNAIINAIGDPDTCVLIAEKGDVVYRFGTHVVCGRALPSCDGANLRTADDLLKQASAGGAPVTASCPSNADGSRTVGWAAGPVPGRDLTYAAVMEGKATPPGRVIADKLADAFVAAGLSPKTPSAP